MDTRQDYINRINGYIANIDALNTDDFTKKAKENNAANKQADIDVLNAGYNSQINNAQAVYDKRINDAEMEYNDLYKKNAVQKLINEKQIAERNANLGLTDSGLNRTQQTAAQLSYANQKGKIDIARQSALDELSLSLTNTITQLQNEKASNIRKVENQWDNLSNEQGIDAYNKKVDYYNNLIASQVDALNEYDIWQTKMDAAEKERISSTENSKPKVVYGAGGTSTDGYILQTSGGLLSRDFLGSFADNNIDVIHNNNGTTTYVDNNSGKKTTLDIGINPFTGTRNKDLLDENGVYDSSKAFSNGYQPNNIGNNKLFAQEEYEVYVNGKKQKVWSYDDGKTLWAWDGSMNKYVDVTSRRYELKKKASGAMYTYKETPAVTSFIAKIRTKHEFARSSNSDNKKYKTYKDYVKGMLEKYEGDLSDDDIATISQMFGL